MSLTASDFDYLRELVRREAAIVLEPGKEYLALTRLDPIARGEGLASVSDLVARLRAGNRTALHEEVVDALTTNETSFFRDLHPFESLRTHVLPELGERNAQRRTLSIWCAACSSGQEPYSVAMLIREHFPELEGWRIDLLGTDISPSMLERARAGRYGQLEVNRGLPAQLLLKYFRRVGAHWELDDSIRQMVRFQRHNLVGAWPPFPPFDVVFLRNVLIYFGLETKRQVLARVRSVMRPDGYLLLGGSETTLNIDDGFERVPIGRTTWYRPRTQPGRGGDGCS